MKKRPSSNKCEQNQLSFSKLSSVESIEFVENYD